MSFMGHELALHPEIQERLIREIDDLQEALAGKLPTYEDIQGLNYLDMVLSETLRLWPPAMFLDRICTKPLTIEDYDGTEIKFEKGDAINIPVYCLHTDPESFPNPLVFDPERFSVENRGNIKQGSYIPFGGKSRNFLPETRF